MSDEEMPYCNQNFVNSKKNEKKEKLPFVEKYRPSSLSDIVSHQDILGTIDNFVKKRTVPHFLFHGPPGTGKTSCILALAHELYQESFKTMTLELNASDDRGISTVRDKIKDFCGALTNFTLPAKTRNEVKLFKMVILDEADMMTSTAQFALRRVIEKYTDNVRFCIICNQVNKIIPAIQSRCMRFRFKPLNKDQAFKKLEDICKAENIKYDEKALREIIKIGEGDMRKILNLLEATSSCFKNVVNVENVFTCAGLPSDNEITQMITIMRDQSIKFKDAFNEINKIKNENSYSIGDIINFIGKLIKDSELSSDVKITAIKKLSELDYLSCIGGEDEIILSNLISCIRLTNK